MPFEEKICWVNAVVTVVVPVAYFVVMLAGSPTCPRPTSPTSGRFSSPSGCRSS